MNWDLPSVVSLGNTVTTRWEWAWFNLLDDRWDTQDGWGHGREFWQNMVHWRREWQTTPIFLSQEPMKSMKRLKDMTLEDEPPRLVSIQYATGEKQRNSSQKIEEPGPKCKWCSVVTMPGGEIKVWCCKEKYCIRTLNVRPMFLLSSH